MPRRPALLALVLFAFSDDLIYYSSELKPYSLDLAVGLAITLIALGALGKPVQMGRAIALGLAVAIVPWFSFASAFVVAGCGSTLILCCLASRRYRDAAIWGTIGVIWLASFAACHRASLALLSPPSAMYRFWDFAFLPVWPLPMSLARVGRSLGILLEIFVNPLNLVAPVWPWFGRDPAASALAGRRDLAGKAVVVRWALLVLPFALAVVASAMKRYPLHGRLILELVPAFFLLIAAGTEVVRALDPARSRMVYRTVLVLLFLYPLLRGFSQVAFPAIYDFNPHGDMHKNIFIE